MYNTERFLLFARDYFSIPVSQESIEQVRDISRVRQNSNVLHVNERYRQAERAVINWLVAKYPEHNVELNQTGYPDVTIVIGEEQIKTGFDIVILGDL